MKRTELVWQQYQQLSPFEQEQFLDKCLQQSLWERQWMLRGGG